MYVSRVGATQAAATSILECISAMEKWPKRAITLKDLDTLPQVVVVAVTKSTDRFNHKHLQ